MVNAMLVDLLIYWPRRSRGRRVTEYLSVTYINKNSTSMAIVAAIKKYGIENFTLVILEKFNKKISIKNLAEKENY